jgi:quinoprotein glucose dehydrogenase
VEFGVENGIYFSDWVEGWNKTGKGRKGRIYHVFDPNLDKGPIADTKKILNTTLTNLPPEELRALLAHPDQRVRMEAQFAFVSLGESGLNQLAPIALSATNQLAALHAVWGLGQGARHGSQNAALTLLIAARNANPEIRAQAAKVLGEATIPQAGPILQPLLADPEPRVRFFTAISLGRLKHRPALPGLFAMLEENADRDPFLRHAAVMGLVGINDRDALRNAAQNASPHIRLGACLALRRLQDPAVATFLNDTNVQVVAEAARAINDLPIDEAMPQLAALLSKTFLDPLVGKTNTAHRTGVENAISEVAVQTGITTIPEQILLRAINANFRIGAKTNADTLAEFASSPANPENLRAEALDALAAWANPNGRDRITGLWRPVSTRTGDAARTALTSLLNSNPFSTNQPSVRATKEPRIQIALIHAIRQLNLKMNADDLAAFAKPTHDTAVRVEALEALSKLDPSRLRDVLDSALSSDDASLQAEATRLQAEIDPDAALQNAKKELSADSISAKRAAITALAILPQPEADKMLTTLLDRLLQNQIAPQLQLDLLTAAGKRSSSVISERVQRFEAQRPKGDPLGAVSECLQGGNAAEGRKLFYERAEVFCSRCHKIGNDGGETGPNLSGIGSRQPRSYLLESIITPNAKIAQGWENVTISLNDGRSFAGKVVKETDSQIVVTNSEDGDVTIAKSEIKTRNRALSGMPEEFRQILTKQELRDLVEFLASQK